MSTERKAKLYAPKICMPVKYSMSLRPVQETQHIEIEIASVCSQNTIRHGTSAGELYRGEMSWSFGVDWSFAGEVDVWKFRGPPMTTGR